MLRWWNVVCLQRGWLHLEEAAVLYGLVLVSKTYCPKGSVVEIGAYRGRSTCVLAQGCKDVESKLVTIDTFNFKDASKEAVEIALRAGDLSGVVTVIRMDSSQAGRSWKGGLVSLLYIDGNHEYEGVKADWDAWRKHLAFGALVVFHDIDRAGVDKLLSEIKGLDKIGQVRKMAIYQYTPKGVVELKHHTPYCGGKEPCEESKS